ncbi:putative protein kinase RLK-Pelle-RLCK-VIIa-2 family [Helianthus annuus]|uniref:Protein kinase domain-containing protein n=1 Tax=Helianthus annuus TaxID=4232 RepID=A0A9K3IGI9_HELAN|nr:putative protein kinase RLK-Pelle-RLCK-VIIa-2 family [Helianthus annuus]KAJ0539576.1 putative protein kinase RLK-Pelle-RLCK-VIIa-2 family [Helianthus annuus]KAJ0719905.1 putative protein kinase RLK-Pelle-RLCK-VIIa-2 family [Helianthus annuus]KAJ0723135.1 putative protein kinase RLK-Pelle-RLCK-VIIa-2 family [Helianthus annuus]
MHIPVSTSTSTDANPVRNKLFVDTHSNLSAGQANGEVVVNSVKVESQSCMDIVSYPPTGATADVAQTTDNCDNKNLVEKVDVLDGPPQNSVLRNLIKRARSSSALGAALKYMSPLLVRETLNVLLKMQIHAGSIDEDDDEQGIAHMIEHVAFLGSKKREKLLRTSACSNAYTEFHHTVFHIHSPTSMQEYNAKLSDFGLAKDAPEGDKTHVSTRIMGTYGYAAPEYVMTGHLTAKSGVYSFRVVLLEMLTGRRSMDKNRPNGEHNLVEWARPHLGERRRFYKLIDPRLEGHFSIKGAQKAA